MAQVLPSLQAFLHLPLKQLVLVTVEMGSGLAIPVCLNPDCLVLPRDGRLLPLLVQNDFPKSHAKEAGGLAPHCHKEKYLIHGLDLRLSQLLTWPL